MSPPNTLLLVGGDLCVRTARLLDPARWRCLGLRRRRMAADAGDAVTWYQADLQNPDSLDMLGDEAFAGVTHILYAPAPGSRTQVDYDGVYAAGVSSLLDRLPPKSRQQLRRCVLVGSSAVWGPSAAWVDEQTPADATGFRAQAILDAEAALAASLPAGVGVALRLSGLYGPGRVRLLQGLLAGSIIAPDGPGHWANRIHIDDAARACAHLLTLPDPQPLYIGTDDHPMPTAELYDALARMAGAALPARQVRAASGKRLSNARLKASGWAPDWPNALDGYAALRT